MRDNYPNVSTLSVDELKKNLLTADYRGEEYKRKCLDRLIELAKQELLVELAENCRNLDE